MPPHRYQIKPEDKTAKSCQQGVRVHYKNTYAVGRVLVGMELQRAKKYLNNVIRKSEAVPFRKYTRGIGRHAQGNEFKHVGTRWPTKSAYAFLSLLRNAEANAKVSGLKKEKLYVSHVCVNKAPQMRRRTFRAHGRIGPYNYNPSHMEIILKEKDEETKVPPKKEEKKEKKEDLLE